MTRVGARDYTTQLGDVKDYVRQVWDIIYGTLLPEICPIWGSMEIDSGGRRGYDDDIKQIPREGEKSKE